VISVGLVHLGLVGISVGPGLDKRGNDRVGQVRKSASSNDDKFELVRGRD
jgi:hypothetical protein